MARTLSILSVGAGSLAALVMIAAILASSLGTPALPGHELAHFLEVITLVLTLAAIVLAWGHFGQRSDRRLS